MSHQLPENSTSQKAGYPARTPLRMLAPFLVLALLCCIWALFASHLEALMTASFLVVVPLIIGALITYIQNYQTPVSFLKTIKVILIFLAFLLIFSVIVLREGTICVVIMLPIMFLGMLLGAGVMKWLCQKIWKPHKAFFSIALLPFILLPLPEKTQLHYDHVQKSIIIDAPAEVIWQQIIHAQDIQTKPALQHRCALSCIRHYPANT